MGAFTRAGQTWPPETPDHLDPYAKDRWVQKKTALLTELYPGIDHRTFLMSSPTLWNGKMYYPGGSKEAWEKMSSTVRVVATRPTNFEMRTMSAEERTKMFEAEGSEVVANGTIGASGGLTISDTYKRYLPLILVALIVFFIIFKK